MQTEDDNNVKTPITNAENEAEVENNEEYSAMREYANQLNGDTEDHGDLACREGL